MSGKYQAKQACKDLSLSLYCQHEAMIQQQGLKIEEQTRISIIPREI